MYITDLDKTEAIDITPAEIKSAGSVTVRWLLGEEQGAPNFELRYFSLAGMVATDWHYHSWEHQVYVIEGSGRLRTEKQEIELTPGNAVLVPPEEQHQFICAGEKFDFICVVPKGTRVCNTDAIKPK